MSEGSRASWSEPTLETETLERVGFRLDGWTISPPAGTVDRGGESLRLQPKAMELLVFLAARAGEVTTKEEILEKVWAGSFVEEGALAQCVHSLRKALDDDPKEPHFIETIPRRGYRLIAPVAPLERVAEEPTAGVAPRGLWTAVVAVLLAALALFAAWSRRLPETGDGAKLEAQAGVELEDEPPSLVILPFRTIAPPEREPEVTWVAEGLGEQLETALALLDLRLKFRFSTDRARETDRDLRAQVEELGVDYLLEGSLLWHEDRVEVRPKLVRIRDRSQLWNGSYERELGEVLAVTAEIADRVGDEIGVRVRDGPNRLRRSGTSRIPEANVHYIRGLALLGGPKYDEEKYLAAVHEFERAVELDPDFAEAHAELSKASSYLCFNGHRAFGEVAREALDRARELAPDLKTVTLAEAYYHYRVEHDHKKAVDHFLRAADGDPHDREILLGIGYALRRLGKIEESSRRLEEAFELDPLDPFLAGTLAKSYAARRDFERAENWYARSLAAEPDQPQIVGERALNLLHWRGCPSPDEPCSTAEAWASLNRDAEALTQPEKLAYFVFLLDLYDAAVLPAADKLVAFRAALAELEAVPVEARDPDHERALFWRRAHLLGVAGERQRQRELAERYRARFTAEIEENPDYAYPRSHLAMALAFLGEGRAALDEGCRAVEMAARLERFSSPRQKEFLAVIHVVLGENDEALELLEELLRTDYQYALTRVQLRLDPVWDPLRGDPRFERLLVR